MHDPFFEYYLIHFGILAIVLVGVAVATGYWFLRRRWLRKQKTLEQALADCHATNYQMLQRDFHQIIAHEYNKGLDYILNKSTETLEGLGKEQSALRDKQRGIIAKAHDLKQHAMNILKVFDMQPGKLKKELLNIRQLVESVLLELFSYAESKGVTLRPALDDIEPIFLDRDLTMLTVRNLVHNAIKYSDPGRVVEIRLTSVEDAAHVGKTIVISVKDHGQGIRDADKERIFEQDLRGDGLVETGNGLGLYGAKKAARLQGGNVILANSTPGEGSVFEISLPSETVGEAIPETQAVTSRQTRPVWLWVAVIVVVLAAGALLYILLKPPPQIAIKSYHGRYITALGVDNGWVMTQDPAVGNCGKFTLFELGNNKVALRTCNGRYVTAPTMSNPNLVTTQHDPQWQLWQESSLGDCGAFDMIEQPEGKVAFRTCMGMVVTAGDVNWPGEMAWAVVAERAEIKEWEQFTLESQR